MSRDRSELRLNELFRIQGSMVVLTSRDGSGEIYSCGVDCLKDTFEMGSTGDFLNENGREPLGT